MRHVVLTCMTGPSDRVCLKTKSPGDRPECRLGQRSVVPARLDACLRGSREDTRWADVLARASSARVNLGQVMSVRGAWLIFVILSHSPAVMAGEMAGLGVRAIMVVT